MKKLFALLVSVVLALSAIPASAKTVSADVLSSGSCGDNLEWVLNTQKTLTITGTGVMDSDPNWTTYRTDIENVIINEGAVSISDAAFAYCNNLTTVQLPSTMKTIGVWAFGSCSELSTINLPDGITSIGEAAFTQCSSLKSIILPSQLVKIESGLFMDCEKLLEIILPENITSIGDQAFSNTAITEIKIPDTVTRIGQSAFELCKTLKTINIPNGVANISSNLFSLTESLKTIVLPDSIQSIDPFAFTNCFGLESIVIPKNVNSIGTEAFSGCSSLRSITFKGSERDRTNITIEEGNEPLLNATWVYDYDSTSDPEPIPTPHTHSYDNACDTTCSGCDFVRETTHAYGAFASDGNATVDADGTKTRTCSVCGNKETVTDVGSKIVIKDTSKIFTDIPRNKWYKQYVDYSVANGIFTGTSATTFSPNSNITRAQFVQVLANLEGVDTSNRNVITKFTDVPSGKWFTAAVKWASENGVVNGVGNGKFDSNANVTREQMCLMLVNFAKFKGITLKAVEDKASFVDDAKISGWAKTAVYTCQQADIVNGKGEGKFDPQGTGTRAEASVIFTKFHKDYLVK